MGDQPGIHGDGATRPGNHRVALQLGQLVAQPISHPVGTGNGQQQVHERVGIHRWLAPETGQQLSPFEAGHHRLGVSPADRQQPQHHLVKHLRQGPPQTERHHQAKRRPVHHPNQQLNSSFCLLLDEKPFEAGAYCRSIRCHRRSFVVQLIGGQPQTHRPYIRLMDQPPAPTLEHQLPGQPLSFRGCGQH